VITSSEVEPGGWSPIPHATAQDPRIDRRALGLLVEILSYPPGWDINMLLLGKTGREGRDANRAAFQKLTKAGYIVEWRYRESGRWKTATFAGVTPAQAQRVSDAWLQAHPNVTLTEKPRSLPRTEKPTSVEPTSENPASYSKNERKTENKITFGEARDKSLAIDDPAIAEAPAPPAARTTGSFDQEAPKIPAQRTYSSNRERDDDWRIQLAMANLDNLYEALNAYRDRLGALEDWAYRTAASDLGIDLDPKDEIPEDPDDDWTRAAYLYLLKRHDNDGDWDALFTLMEPLDPDTRAAPRPYQWVEKLSTPPGMTSQQFAEQMRAAVMQMEPAEAGPYIAEFRDLRPKVWHESRQQAMEWLRARKQKVTAQAMNCAALQLAIERYVPKGRWEMPLVPPSMRPVGMQSVGEPPSWAA